MVVATGNRAGMVVTLHSHQTGGSTRTLKAKDLAAIGTRPPSVDSADRRPLKRALVDCLTFTHSVIQSVTRSHTATAESATQGDSQLVRRQPG